jgi:MFS family permease
MQKDEPEKDRAVNMGKGGGRPVRSPLFGMKTFRSLENPVFRLYYGAQLCDVAAMNIQMIARSLLIYRITGSAAILGGLSLAFSLPMLLLALLGGAIADRVQKKYVLFMGHASSAAVVLCVALSLNLGYLSAQRPGSWWILAMASIFQGCIMGLNMPSRKAIIHEIVRGEQLLNAISLDSLGMNTFRLFAPAMTGFLIDAFDFKTIYYTMTCLYVIGTTFILLMPVTGKSSERTSSAITDIKEGLRYIRQDTTILLLLIFTLFAVVLSLPYMFMMPVFTEDILKVGATGMGVLLSISGIGAMVGSLILASLPNRKRGLILLTSVLLMGLTLTAFSFSTSWYLSLALMVLVGLGHSGRMSLSNTLLQYYVEDEYRGRVMSIYMMEFGLMGFGTFASGLIAAAFGVQWAIGGLAMLLVLVTVLTLVFVPHIRRLE